MENKWVSGIRADRVWLDPPANRRENVTDAEPFTVEQGIAPGELRTYHLRIATLSARHVDEPDATDCSGIQAQVRGQG
jgi:hypothetical protein